MITIFKYKCTLKCNMTIKSLTITEEAYEALKRLKFTNESFSEVILRISKEKIGLVTKYLGALKMSEEEAEEWIKSIKKWRGEFDEESSERIKNIRKRLE